MADLNDMSKPDLISNYSTEVLQTIKGHIARLWTGDYTGMGGLVTNMRRWVDLGGGDARLVKLNADGSETTIFDSTAKATKSYVDAQVSSEAAARNSAVTNEAISRALAIGDAISEEVSSRNSAISFAISAEAASRNAEIQKETNARILALSTITQKGIGFGGTLWVDVKSKRAQNVWYTNTRSYPIAVSIQRLNIGASSGAQLYLDGFLPISGVSGGNYDGSSNAAIFSIIPPNVGYLLSGSFSNWFELY